MLKLVLFEYVPGSYGYRFELNGTALMVSTRQYFSVEAVIHDLKELCTGINTDDFTVYDDTESNVFSDRSDDQTDGIRQQGGGGGVPPGVGDQPA